MDTKRYCVYNKTTSSFLSVGASVVDTELEPVKAQQMMVDVENLTAESSFWLKPFKAVPVARIICPFDMVFLDEDLRVVHAVELSPAVELPPFEDRPASALVLPLHTAYSSRTYPGDQLIICAAEELVRHLARVPVAATPAPAVRNTRSYPEQPRNPGPVLVGEPAEKRQVAAQPQGNQPAGGKGKVDVRGSEEKRRLEFQAEEIDAVISQVRSWAGEPPRPRAAVSIAPTTVPARKNKGSATTETNGNGGSAPRLPNEPPLRKQTASLRLEESEQVEHQIQGPKEGIEFQPEEVDSVVSQVLRWAEETGRPLARAPIAVTPPSPASRGADSNAEQPRGESVPAGAVADDRLGREQTAIQPVEETERPKERPTRSWITRFLPWSERSVGPFVGRAATAAAGRRSRNIASEAERRSIRSSLGIHVKRLQAATEQISSKTKAPKVATHRDSLRTRFSRWLDADSLTSIVPDLSERRRSKRHPLPGLVAYYWTGGTPQANQIGDISSTGFYLLTVERWIPDTLIRMTLQRPGPKGDKAEEAISVISRVVRWGEDGVGYEFVASKALEISGEPVDRRSEARQRLF